VLQFEKLRLRIFGGKGVGSQGDGTAEILAKSAADQEMVIKIVEKDLKLSCLRLTLHAIGL
jgi:galactokinase